MDREVALRPGAREINGRFSLSRIAIDHLWATILFWVLVCVGGAWSLSQLKFALFPDIAFPVVIVEAKAPIMAAPAMVSAVTAPIERQLLQVDGVSSVRSSTFPGFATAQVAFGFGLDVNESAYQTGLAVRRALTPPIVLTSVTPINLNESAVATYALTSGTHSLADLTEIARRLAEDLETIDGVLRVDVQGAADAGGRRKQIVQYDALDAVALSVIKTAGANTLDVADELQDRLRLLHPAGDGVDLVLASTQAPYIREASRATTEALAIAIALSVIVIYPFLRNLRATVIAALAIPTSLLGTAIVMRLFRFNLETITLLALALVVGVIIDDAIVAVENVVRHSEEGQSAREAARIANKEIGRTLVAATFTVVAVFLPIGLMGGTLGQFFKPFGITASAAILLSLLVARTLTPALAAVLLRQEARRTDESSHHVWYRRALDTALHHRRAVVVFAVGAFLAGIAIIPFIPRGFLPHLDRGAFRVSFSLSPEAPLAQAQRAGEALVAALRDDPAVASAFTTYGVRQPGEGVIEVTLKPTRDATTIAVENRVRPKLPALPGVSVSVDDVPFVENGTVKPLQLALVGNDLDTLRATALSLERWMVQESHIFVDITTSGLFKEHGYERIDRLNGRDAVNVSADLAPGVRIGDATDRVSAEIKQILPPSVSLDLGGISADAQRTFASFGGVLALSVLGILGVLYALFRNFADPLVISVALPLSIVGAFFALWITRSEFGMISLMGVVFLFGLVNKNAILLVDAIKRLRSDGLSRHDAILEAGSQRLRPILMTTAATILGMLPIAMGFGAGAELRAPMAVAIIGGLVTSTLFSLIVVPVVYTIVDDLFRRRQRFVLVGEAKAS